MKYIAVVTLIHPNGIRHIGPFESLDEAYCYAEEIVKNIKQRYPVHKLSYTTHADGWWEADFNPSLYDNFIPEVIKVNGLTDPREYSIWYASKR